MAFRIRVPHVIALGLAAGLTVWMATGTFQFGGQQEAGEGAPAVAEREAERSAELFKVRFVPMQPRERFEEVRVRGRTQAEAVVPIRVETAGVLEKRLVNKGDRVNAGDEVCRIDTGVRQSRTAQAKAQLSQAQAEYEANEQLQAKGYASQNKMNQLKFALDAAKAAVAEAEWEMQHTVVKANASGIVQDPIAEPGDVLSVGAACVTLIDTDPILFSGQVSERDIGKVKIGMSAEVTLVTGDTLSGKVRYISTSSDPATRTFLTEIELPNGEGQVRDGLTATAVIRLPSTTAFQISPAWITLADSGETGVRIVDEADMVEFVPVRILAQTKDGFWVSGLKAGMRVITLGQEYVVAGEKVDPQPDPVLKADAGDAREVQQ